MAVYRPNIRYFSHDKSTLVVEKNYEKYFYQIPSEVIFDFSILSKGAYIDQIDKSALSFLLEQNLVEEVPAIAIMHNAVELFKSEFGSADEIHLVEELIKNGKFNILSISKKNINFSILENLNAPFQILANAHEATDESEHLVYVISDSLFDPNLDEVNKVFLKKNINWVLLVLENNSLLIGPNFNTKLSLGCLNCLQRRATSKSPLLKPKEILMPTGFNKNILPLVSQVVSLQILRLFLTRNYSTEGKITCFNFLNLSFNESAVLFYPICEVCNE